MEDGFRRAARQTIAIVRKHLPAGVGRVELERTLEANYPFFVSGGLARRLWRREVRTVLKELGYRPRPRHHIILVDGETRRERHVRLQARLTRRLK